MYNFFDRIKVPLTDYLKHNPHKNEDGEYIDIEEQIINGHFPNEIKKSTSVHNSLQSSLVISPSMFLNNNNNNEHQNENLSPRNVIPIPTEISDCNTVVSNYGGSIIEFQQDHLLPQRELKNILSATTTTITNINNNNKNNNESENLQSLLDQSNKLQGQMKELMIKMQMVHQNLNSVDETTIVQQPEQQPPQPQFNFINEIDEIIRSSSNSRFGNKTFYNSTELSDISSNTIIDIFNDNSPPIEINQQQHEQIKISSNVIIKSNSILDIDDIVMNVFDHHNENKSNEIIEIIPPTPNSTISTIPRNDSTIKMVIPKIKSKFNKEKMERFKKSVFQILKPLDTSVPIHIVDKDQTDNKVVPFLMELGRALIMSGVPSHRLEFELTLISSTFGLDGHFFTTPTGIFFSFGSPHSILSPYTHFLRINSTDYNMARMVSLEKLADKVIYGEMNCIEALDKLKEILSREPLYNIYTTIFSFVMASFAVAFFFKVGWYEVGASSMIGLYVGLLCWLSSKLIIVGRVLEALSSFGAAFIASLFNAYIYPIPIFIVTLGGIIVLAPGLALTLAVSEISTRNLVSGTSRLVSVFVCLLQITFGIAFGTKLCDLILPLRTEIAPDSFPIWSQYLVIPIAAIAFGIQLKVNPKQFWVIILASAIGVLCGNYGSEYFGDIGSFFGSFAICVLGNLYSRFSNVSAIVPIMTGIILLVPGSIGVKGLISVTSGDTQSGIELFLSMFLIGVSLCIGLLIANLLVPPSKSM